MKNRITTCILGIATVFSVLHSVLLFAQMLSNQEASSVSKELERVRTSLDGYGDATGKIQFLQRTLTQTTNASVRQGVFAMGEAVGGDGYEELLINVVERDQDVGLRLSAVHQLTKYGTSRAIQPLLNCAQSDPTGSYQLGNSDIMMHGNARRDAYFALADIGLRLTSERERISKAIREIPVTTNSDPQTQALYILTGEERLLHPFYERLASVDPQTRISGVVAFRFLKLKRAPKEVTHLIHDSKPEVRSWVALVLGEIGDPETIPVLMEVANNKKEDHGTRCNAISSLGEMRAKDATAMLERLLLDEDIKVNAAIALSKITGVRHPLVPDGYNLD